MKIITTRAVTLLGCSAVAGLLALLPHRHAAAAAPMHHTSAALAEAMSTHGITVASAEAEPR